MNHREKDFNPSRLVLARQVRALTRKELAEKVKITQRQLWRLEIGAKKPNTLLLNKFCEILDFPPGFFFEQGKIIPIDWT